MKKFILSATFTLLYFLSCCFVLPKQTALAQPTASYACICNNDTYFYAAKDERRGLFLLPQTYYVKILSVDAQFCKIEYLYDSEYTQKLTGYAKTSNLTFVDYLPNNPYLTHLFEVDYTIGGTDGGNDGFLDKITITCAYYGDYIVGSERYCYVLRGDSFGYVPKPIDFAYEQNTEYADYLASQKQDEPPSQSSEHTENEGMSSAQIAILIVLCLLVPTLTALILKPPKKPPYEDE